MVLVVHHDDDDKWDQEDISHRDSVEHGVFHKMSKEQHDRSPEKTAVKA